MSYSPPSSLIFWLKADADVYLDNPTPPTSPTPCGDLDSVHLWKNQATTGSDYDVQNTSNNPQFRTAQLNGHPGVLFNRGVPTYLTTSGSVAHGIGTGNFLIAAVYQTYSDVYDQQSLFSIGAYSPVLYSTDGGGPYVRFYLGSGLTFTDFTPIADTTYFTLCGRTSSPVSSTIHAWTTEIGSLPVVSTVSATNTTSIATNPFYVGSDTESGLELNGLLYELMLFNAELSTDDWNKLVNYLSQKYANTTPAPSSESGSGASMFDF